MMLGVFYPGAQAAAGAPVDVLLPGRYPAAGVSIFALSASGVVQAATGCRPYQGVAACEASAPHSPAGWVALPLSAQGPLPVGALAVQYSSGASSGRLLGLSSGDAAYVVASTSSGVPLFLAACQTGSASVTCPAPPKSIAALSGVRLAAYAFHSLAADLPRNDLAEAPLVLALPVVFLGAALAAARLRRRP